MRLNWVLALLLSTLPLRAQVVAPTHSDAVTDLRTIVLCKQKEIGRVPAPGTEAGYITETEGVPRVLAQTQIVPDALGMSFGVSVVPLYDVTAARILLYRPNRPLPEFYTKPMYAGVESTTTFSFDVPSEQVPGTWTFEAWDGEQLLFRAAFQVLPEEAAPGLVGQCRVATS